MYVYIYKTIRYNNMWWQLKLYTCSGENERQEQLKDSKILKFWRFVMQGSWPVRIAGWCFISRVLHEHLYIILIFYNSAIIIFFADGLCIIKITLLLWKKLGVGKLGLTFIIKEHMLHASLYLLHPIPLSLFTELDDGNIGEHLLDAPSFWW